MKNKRMLLGMALTINSFTALAQTANYTVANAHSHNDYEQHIPFYQAYNEQFGSIEADIHLRNGQLLVAHDSAHVTPAHTLEGMYLQPLAEAIKKNNGFVYSDTSRRLQLLIDIKTDSINTLQTLVALLKKYPLIINNKTVRVVITGNRPGQQLYSNYPSFIWFDGNADVKYSATALPKIAMLSDEFARYSKWKGIGPMPDSAVKIVASLISNAHALKKPIRFYGCPDMPVAWKEMMALKADYLNTDHIVALSDFLLRRGDSLRLMPFNRILKSAGEVIRFGNPKLENHALDVAALPYGRQLVIEDRYGIAIVNATTKKITGRWSFADDAKYKNYMSTYSGIKTFVENDKTYILWGAAQKDGGHSSVMIAEYNKEIGKITDIPVEKQAPAVNALPNEIAVTTEKGTRYIYVVVNGNNELLKIKWKDRSMVWRAATGVAPYGITVANNKIYVTNWAGNNATDSLKERAGVPWGLAYTNPVTGATAEGSVIVLDPATGKGIKNISTGLHPTAITASGNGRFVYVACGSNDVISVINTKNNVVSETINAGILKGKNSLQGSTPDALTINDAGSILYVANGFDNAIAVVVLGKKASLNGNGISFIKGYIPAEAYPGGLKLSGNALVVANLEGDGANVVNPEMHSSEIHEQLASVSIIPLPDKKALQDYTQQVAQLSMLNRVEQFAMPARKGIAAVPVPERLGEPSVFKHVVYIIKENKTYDQVFGDMGIGKSDSSLCVFGEKVTPNMHALAKQFGWMDDYYASGKSSAEGHQWTDAGMVSDYVEKNVRAWFRSYPHRQEDALVYNRSGFIWNHALDHGKTVRVYGEACKTQYDTKLKWADIYSNYTSGAAINWYNTSTINRIRPIISPAYPDCDNIHFTDQLRADIFIKEWKDYEQAGVLPDLLLLSLPNDHSAGTSPDFPAPDAMVADNDLATGRIVDMITKSKFWDSTVIFITQDDSQSGWDHISAYRTVGLTISPYSSGKLVTANYNQTSMLRTIEQILGLPPMNLMDGTARLMTDCFTNTKNNIGYNYLPNNIPFDKMNKPLHSLSGKARKFALQSQNEVFKDVDGGDDNKMNRIIWYYAKGETIYPENNEKQD